MKIAAWSELSSLFQQAMLLSPLPFQNTKHSSTALVILIYMLFWWRKWEILATSSSFWCMRLWINNGIITLSVMRYRVELLGSVKLENHPPDLMSFIGICSSDYRSGLYFVKKDIGLGFELQFGSITFRVRAFSNWSKN